MTGKIRCGIQFYMLMANLALSLDNTSLVPCCWTGGLVIVIGGDISDISQLPSRESVLIRYSQSSVTVWHSISDCGWDWLCELPNLDMGSGNGIILTQLINTTHLTAKARNSQNGFWSNLCHFVWVMHTSKQPFFRKYSLPPRDLWADNVNKMCEQREINHPSWCGSSLMKSRVILQSLWVWVFVCWLAHSYATVLCQSSVWAKQPQKPAYINASLT